MDKYRHGDVIASATGQLKWDTGLGLIQIDTDGTQGVVGFLGDDVIRLSRFSIKPACKYASILATAAEPNASLASGGRVLVSAVAQRQLRIPLLDDRRQDNRR